MVSPVLSVEDQKRFNELTDASYRKVLNLAYRLAGNRSDAEDLTQEAYYRAYRGFHSYEGDRPFENWIFRIVTRLFLDMTRRRKRRVQTVSSDAPLRSDATDDTVTLDAADPSAGPEQILLDRHFSEPIACSLQELSEDQRMLIMLADVERIPYQEIADLLGTPVGTIRSRLHRIHKRLRERLGMFEARRCSKPNCCMSAG
jgi:RNA polymerase sigma-70 factor (ECF subfamily)